MSPSSHVLAQLGAFIQELQGLRYQVPEDEAAVARGALFAPRLARTIEEAAALLATAQTHYERFGTIADEQVARSDSLDDIGRLISSEIAGQEITDVLFLARGQLKEALQDLVAAVDQEDFLRVASSCDSGVRTLKRTLIAAESAIYEYEGMSPPMRQWIDLEVSLRTRRLYADLRRDILGGSTPEDAELGDRLAAVRDQFAALRELEIYPLLRFDDRVAMRELRRRLAAWVSADGQDLVDGRRLWQDIAGFADLIAAVSHRQELRQHDRALLRRTFHALFGRAARPGSVSDDLLHGLGALQGLDEELDQLLERGEHDDLPRWRRALTRLLQQLSTRPRATGAEAADWLAD